MKELTTLDEVKAFITERGHELVLTINDYGEKCGTLATAIQYSNGRGILKQGDLEIALYFATYGFCYNSRVTDYCSYTIEIYDDFNELVEIEVEFDI